MPAARWLVGELTLCVLALAVPCTLTAQLRPAPPDEVVRRAETGRSRTVPPVGAAVAADPLVTSSVRVNDVTTGGQHVPTVRLGLEGEIYVAWVDCRDDPECAVDTAIYFAKSVDGGATFGASVLVSDDGSSAFANVPKLGVDSEGTIFVAWHDDRTGDSWDVYVAASHDGGASFDASVRVNPHVADSWSFEPDLAVAPDDTLLVSWQRYAYDADALQWDYEAMVATSSDGGASFTTPLVVNDGSGWQYKTSIEVGPSGTVYAAWTDTRSGGSDIYFASSSDGGATFGANVLVNSTTASSQGYPEIAVDALDTVYVVWNDGRRYADGSNDVYLARSLDSGASFDDETLVNDADISTEADYMYPSISAVGKGHVGVAWYDKRTGDWDVYLSRSDDRGASFLPSWRINDLTANGQSVPDLWMAADGAVHCAYRDNSADDFDIYYVRDDTVPRHALHVGTAGLGSGTVTSLPAGIDCGGSCEAAFLEGADVTLTATDGPNSVFAGWDGACTGSTACQVTLDEELWVNATFDLGGACVLEIVDHAVTVAEEHTACFAIMVAPAVSVEAPAELRLRAAGLIAVRNGFSVQAGAAATLAIDPTLADP